MVGILVVVFGPRGIQNDDRLGAGVVSLGSCVPAFGLKTVGSATESLCTSSSRGMQL